MYYKNAYHPENINIYQIIPWCHGLWSGVFCLGLSMRFAELKFSVEYSLVRAPPWGGGSNDPRPAVSVPHIDVNADGCRARDKREVAKIPHVCRGEFRRFWLYLNVCNAWMIYKIGIIPSCYCFEFCGGILSSVCFAWPLQGWMKRLFVLLDVCRAWTNETRKSLRGATRTRKSFRVAAPTPLALPYPLGTSTWTRMDAERDKEGRSCKNIAFWGGNLATSVVSYNNVCSVWIIFKIGIISKWWVVAKVLNSAVVFFRAFVLLDVCMAWALVCFDWRMQGLNEWNTQKSSEGGFNPPRPSLSVGHLDVNADERWARQGRSCKNTVFWWGNLST